MVKSSPVYRLLLLAKRHADLCRRLNDAAISPLLDVSLFEWISDDDRGLPQQMLRYKLRRFLETDFETLAGLPGVGTIKLCKLFDLLDRILCSKPTNEVLAENVKARSRAEGALPPSTARNKKLVSPKASYQRCFAEAMPPTAVWWDRDRALLIDLGLDRLPIGQVISSLSELPRCLWRAPVGEFTRHSYLDLQGMPSLGRSSIAAVVQLVHDIARTASHHADADHNQPIWSAPEVQEATKWAEYRTLLSERPSTDSVLRQFIAPLLRRIELDLGPREVAVVRHAILADAPELRGHIVGSLYDIDAIGSSRLRHIRLLIADAVNVRFPRGADLIQRVIEHASRFTRHDDSVRLLRSAGMLLFFGRIASRGRLRTVGRPSPVAEKALN